MKHENHTGTSRPALAVKTFLSGIAAVALLGLSINAQAQTCTVGNWGSAQGLDNDDTSFQVGGQFRRYGGPCGLRVPVDGTPRFLTDATPSSESTYIVRFYAFFDGAGDNDILVFAADDGSDNVIEVFYNVDGGLLVSPGDLTLNVVDASSQNNTLTFSGIGAGWHSIEIVWEASDGSGDPNVRFALNSNEEDDADLYDNIDTSGIQILNARLGNIEGASGGYMNFDDFDSRRISRPGRLCRGLTDPDRAPTGDGYPDLGFEDMDAIFIEMATFGNNPAGGQPDFNEDGMVDFGDMDAIFIRMATFNESCAVNR